MGSNTARYEKAQIPVRDCTSSPLAADYIPDLSSPDVPNYLQVSSSLYKGQF